MGKERIRNCPVCDGEIYYSSSQSYYRAIRKNTSCRKCTGFKSGHTVNLGRHPSKKTKKKMSQNSAKFWLGKKFSDEMKKTLSNAQLGKKLSNATKTKISKNSAKFWLGKKRSDESKTNMSLAKLNNSYRLNTATSPLAKRNMRLAAIKKIQSHLGQIYPSYNKTACKIFDEINNELKWNGQYAENGGEFYIKELGYWIDYYEPILNIVIEYDEKYHTQKHRAALDAIRQAEIIKHLKCQFYRIKYNENWKCVLETHLNN